MAAKYKARKKKSGSGSESHDMQGNLLAADYVVGQIKASAADIIHSATGSAQKDVANCVLKELARCLDRLQDCRAKKRGGGRGPDCGPGYHEYAGRCVPDTPDSNG